MRVAAAVAMFSGRGFLTASPILRQQIVGVTASEVRLKGDITIGVHAGSHRTIRGRTLLAVVGDETSFWRDETSATPDLEIYRACMPALAASKGMWVGISTGYRKLGLLYAKYRDHFGQSGDDILVIQGVSEQFNSTLDPAKIASARASDPEAAASEWGGEFRADISSFLDEETVERVTDYSRPLEIPPRQGISHAAFVDPSGGRHDAFTLAIGHKEGTGSGSFYVCDAIRGIMPPFDPQSVVAEYAALLKDYRVHSVTGDNYSAAWCEAAFTKAGIKYVRSEMNKSQLYVEALPLFMRQAISIPNYPKLSRELRLLERRTSRSGRDQVDHGPHGSDDYANALAGLLQALTKKVDISMSWVSNEADADVDRKETHGAAMLKNYLINQGFGIGQA